MDAGTRPRRTYRIAMISDFFHPNVGGVEGHIQMLALELIARGHTVIVFTHTHPGHLGVRHLASGLLKVYYLPVPVLTASATLPNFLLFLPYLRHLLVRESIDVVHGHASLSSLALEGALHAPLLGIRTVWTDHSLFGFGDAVGVLTNKLLRGCLRNLDAGICVSHTGRENTVLRAGLDPKRTYVIPNAVVPAAFPPAPERAANPSTITIVVVARLVYRKGIDLLIASAPHVCALFPHVRFVIGGDGPKMVELEQMREQHALHDAIELLGNVAPAAVSAVLRRGHIFLNTSLTEAFGTALVEAASSGLLVVSTRVGGIPEVLPEDMVVFAEPNEDDVVRALTLAIHRIDAGDHSPAAAHDRVKGMYAWADVAARTEQVYDDVFAVPARSTWERLVRLRDTGPVFGLIMTCIVALEHVLFLVLELWSPRASIERVPVRHPQEALDARRRRGQRSGEQGGAGT